MMNLINRINQGKLTLLHSDYIDYELRYPRLKVF